MVVSGWAEGGDGEGVGCGGGGSSEKRDGEGAMKDKYWSRTYLEGEVRMEKL